MSALTDIADLTLAKFLKRALPSSPFADLMEDVPPGVPLSTRSGRSCDLADAPADLAQMVSIVLAFIYAAFGESAIGEVHAVYADDLSCAEFWLAVSQSYLKRVSVYVYSDPIDLTFRIGGSDVTVWLVAQPETAE